MLAFCPRSPTVQGLQDPRQGMVAMERLVPCGGPGRLFPLVPGAPITGQPDVGPGRIVCSIFTTEGRLLGAGGEDQLFHLQSWSWSLHLKASLGLIESPCLTIASNFIAFMERRVLFLAAKIFYVPIFFYVFCLLVGRWGPRLFISSK